MLKSTITCSMGCDPGLLERNHTVEFIDRSEHPVCEYYCEGCSWDAKFFVFSGQFLVMYDPFEENHYHDPFRWAEPEWDDIVPPKV